MPTARPAVKALIADGGKFLLLEQSTGNGTYWTLPGGKVEFGESPVEALEREVREEVGLSGEPDDPVGVYDFTYDQSHVVVTVLRFLVRSGDYDVDVRSNPADESIVSYEWVGESDLTDRTMNDGLAELLDSLPSPE